MQKLIILFGVSGSGKSTIAELILRNYDPNNGEVLIDDKNLKRANGEWVPYDPRRALAPGVTSQFWHTQNHR